jgi:TPR repeat protein
MAALPTWTILGGGYQSYLKGDYKAAYEEWLPLAELGDAEAQFNLGVMHDEGAGIARDLSVASEWYLKAAEQGFVDAQTNLGILYMTGQGVPCDKATAGRWLRKAAAQGDAEAADLLQQLGIGL